MTGDLAPGCDARDLTGEERARYPDAGYVAYETYPSGSAALGRLWTQAQLDSVRKGCGAVTTMAQAIAETYARSPAFYGATYCVGCRMHRPVGQDGEFVWVDDGSRVGT